MKVKHLCSVLLTNIFLIYLRVVIWTGKIDINYYNGLKKDQLHNAILGFWHGDSCLMYLLAKKLVHEGITASVVVTADYRGDFIERICKAYGIKVLRIPDGVRCREYLEALKKEAQTKNTTLCIALDGPLGPLHEPKKLAFFLSNSAKKPVVVMQMKATKKITLNKRWDFYAIPLPFSLLKVVGYPLEIVSDEQLRHFKKYKEMIKTRLMRVGSSETICK